jgi:hypothetical protein
MKTLQFLSIFILLLCHFGANWPFEGSANTFKIDSSKNRQKANSCYVDCQVLSFFCPLSRKDQFAEKLEK